MPYKLSVGKYISQYINIWNLNTILWSNFASTVMYSNKMEIIWFCEKEIYIPNIIENKFCIVNGKWKIIHKELNYRKS